MKRQKDARVDGHQTPTHLLFVADAIGMAMGASAYMVSLSLPAYVVWHFVPAHPIAMVGALLVAVPAAAALFAAWLVLLKLLVARKVPNGRIFLDSPRAVPWFLADRIMKVAYRSPFRPLLVENGFFRWPFLRAMGAAIHPSFMMGNGAKLPEPWAVRIGRGVVLGDNASISGHKVERRIVTLGTVEVGNNVIIGAKSTIFPNVKIGDRALIGANSVVVQGTVIADGETWAGNPAKKVDLAFPLLATKLKEAS